MRPDDVRNPVSPARAALVLLVAGCTPVVDDDPGDDTDAPAWADVDRDEAAVARVREAIAHTWAGYADVAFGADEVRPLSGTPANWGATSLGLTIVDGWDTLHLAGLDAEADAARAWIRDELEVDLDQDVSAFETNIRVLGGLLAVHAHAGDEVALAKAVDLADRLLPAFDTPTGMPAKFVNLRTGATRETSDVDAAEIGTWVVELGYLSRVTGDDRYSDAARAALVALDDRRDPATGLMASGWDVVTGEPTLNLAQIGGGVDSAYEYLLKGALLTGDADLRARYDAAIGPVHAHLAETTDDGLWYGAADASDPSLRLPYTGGLACFAPGMFALDGDLDRAVAHAEACFAAWERYGVLPEAFDYRSGGILAANHELRPELAESLFVLYRRTGDPVWRSRGLVLLDAWDACCRVDGGYTVLSDVDPVTQGDATPSFWLAESLKYLLLLFEDDAVVDLRAWVLNTEAHPLPTVSAVP